MKHRNKITGFSLLLIILGTISIIFFMENNIARARSLEEIKKTNEIRICLAGSSHEYYKKMGMVFAEWLGVKARVRRLDSWDQQFHNKDGVTVKEASYTPYLLETCECDFYPNDLVVSEWRKKKLDFVTLYPSQMVVLVHNDEQSRFKTKKDLKGKTASLMKGTTFHSWMEEKNKTVFADNPVRIRFMESSAARKQVHDEIVDFTITNLNRVLVNAKKEKLNIRVAFPVGPVTEVGWAFRKEDKELQKAAQKLFNLQLTKGSQFDKIWVETGTSLSDYMLFLSEMLSH